MKTVSSEFRKKMNSGAKFYQTAKIVFADGREKELGKIDFYISGNSYSDGPGTNAFPLGEAMSKHITMLLVNDDDRFLDYDFYMAKITVWLKCDLSETTESVLLGTYTVTTPESYGAQISVEAVDDMYKGDTDYATSITYPATIGEMLRDSCATCGVSLLTTTFANDSFVVQEKPENITHRQLWGMIAMIAGGNAHFDENSYLKIITYDFSYFEQNNNPDGEITNDSTDYHYFRTMKMPTIATNDVVITGVQTIVDDKTHLYGEEGYVLRIDNQLITDKPEEALELIGSLIVGLRFRPFTIDHIAYPLAEFGDLCYVEDRKGNKYQSVVTDIDFTFFGYTTISCSADDPVRNSSKYPSAGTEAVIQARQETKKQITAYDLAVQRLANLIANSFGVFRTNGICEDGSTIFYLHNKPEIKDSDTIWKMTADGFVVSTDGGETWNAGMDSEGNAILNVLSAIGINADWIKAGTITTSIFKVNGKVVKTAADFTEEDLTIVNQKILGLDETTLEDIEKYDIDGDGMLTVLDMIKINSLLLGEEELYEIDTSLVINPISAQNIIKTIGVAIGAKGINTENIKTKTIYADKYYAFLDSDDGSGGSWKPGYTEEFVTADGKIVRADSGIVTNVSKAGTTYDYIVDSGTSGNWRYWKFNSGLAICIHTAIQNGNFTGTAWGTIYCEPTINFDDYPFTWASIPFAWASRTSADTYIYNTYMTWITMSGGSTTSPPKFEPNRADVVDIGHPYFTMVAIGLWK